MSDVQGEPKLPRHRSFGWLIAALGADMAKCLDERLKKMGLHIGLWPTLFALWEKEGMTQVELAKRCDTANYTTTRVLDSLEAKGLVERRSHPTNKKVHLVYLTAEGRQLESEAVAEATFCNETFLADLSTEERGQINAIILKIMVGRNPMFGECYPAT